MRNLLIVLVVALMPLLCYAAPGVVGGVDTNNEYVPLHLDAFGNLNVTQGTLLPSEDPAHNVYVTVAASQTNAKLGAHGAVGDQIDSCYLIPATTAAGTVTASDGGGTAITLYTTGTLADLKPFKLPLEHAISVTGGWTITTGLNESVACVGKFTP